MARRERRRNVTALDRGLIAMVIAAAVAVFALCLKSAPVRVPERPAERILQEVPADVPASSPGRHVMVIINLDSPDSVKIGAYYAKKRGVPRSNLLLLHTTTDDTIDRDPYTRDIEKPGDAFLKAEANSIDYMVFTKGIPLMIRDHGSVDGELATHGIVAKMTGHDSAIGKLWFIDNPYFDKHEHFSRAKYGFSLACRLDGYTAEDAMALVDRSLAASANKGPFLLDGTESRSKPGYGQLNAELGVAAKMLQAKGMDVTYDPGPNFIALDAPLAGYCSWGSNDAEFSAGTYHKLRFKPGALAETFVSTSARTFGHADSGQSLIADLVAQGVTGVKGYVSEPFTFAMAHPTILFDRYTSGYNLAESFYMASICVHWKEIVIGDPLCAPYLR